MDELSKKVSLVQRGLASGAMELQEESLRLARDLPPRTVLPSLLQTYLLDATDESVGRGVLRLLVDVRDEELVKALAAIAWDALPLRKRGELLAVCWQNPLDFSPLIPRMLESLQCEDLSVVIEALTALELALEHAPLADIRSYVGQLKAMEKEKASSDNLPFIREAMSMAAQLQQQAENEARAMKGSRTRDEG